MISHRSSPHSWSCFYSAAHSCPILCDAMDCSTTGLLVPHHLLKFAQVHIHCISDAIQLSHPLMPSSPSPFNLSKHQRLFQWVGCFSSDDQNIGASASASVLPMSIQGWFPLRLIHLISLLSKGLSGVFSRTTVPRHEFFGILPSFRSSSCNPMWPLGRLQPRLYKPLKWQSNASAFQHTV